VRNFQRIGEIDPLPVLLELQRQPELWGESRARQEYDQSPHVAIDDIWVRWNVADVLDDGTTGSDDIRFLPAWSMLPSLRPIVFPLMARVQAVQLGAILLTRIPPGRRVDPHIDEGWHAKRYNTKVYVALQTNPDCMNACENETLVMKPGDCWLFRNTVIHSIVNAGPDDRISLICCMRCES